MTGPENETQDVPQTRSTITPSANLHIANDLIAAAHDLMSRAIEDDSEPDPPAELLIATARAHLALLEAQVRAASTDTTVPAHAVYAVVYALGDAIAVVGPCSSGTEAYRACERQFPGQIVNLYTNTLPA